MMNANASCLVCPDENSGAVYAYRWHVNGWELMKEAEAQSSAAVIQAAYDSLPENGGELVVKSGSYCIEKTLLFNRSHTSICFESGAVLKPANGFTGFIVELGGYGEHRKDGEWQYTEFAGHIKVSGLHIDGEKQCGGIQVHDANYFSFTDCFVTCTKSEALWLRPHAIEGSFTNVVLEYTATDGKSASIRVGADEETNDQANNIIFTNLRVIFPVGPIVFDNPADTVRPVRNFYFYGTQVHWLFDTLCRRSHPELAEYCKSEVNLIQILAGHDIHFLGGNFQFMQATGTFITLGSSQKVDTITIKGRIWGGGAGSTHLDAVNADNLFLPCTISHPHGTAINWRDSKARVHEDPVVLAGEIRSAQGA